MKRSYSIFKKHSAKTPFELWPMLEEFKWKKSTTATCCQLPPIHFVHINFGKRQETDDNNKNLKIKSEIKHLKHNTVSLSICVRVLITSFNAWWQWKLKAHLFNRCYYYHGNSDLSDWWIQRALALRIIGNVIHLKSFNSLFIFKW